MLKQKIKVGNYYEFKISKNRKIAFAVMYRFETGKNKNVYSLMMYTDKKNFEFPIQKRLFDKWIEQGRVKEITSDEEIAHAL